MKLARHSVTALVVSGLLAGGSSSYTGCATWVRVGEKEQGALQSPEDYDNALSSLLRSGAQVLVPFDYLGKQPLSLHVPQWGQSGETSVGVLMLNGRARVVLGVSADGRLSQVTAPTGPLSLGSAALLDDGSRYFHGCFNEQEHAFRIGADGCIEWQAEVTLASCGAGLVGTSAQPGHFAVATLRGESIDLTSVQRNPATEGYLVAATRREPLAEASWLRYVHELAPGDFAYVLEVSGTWSYITHAGMGPPTELTTTELPAGPADFTEAVRREPSGALLVALGDELYRWNVQTDGAVEVLASAPVSDISDGSWSDTQWFGGGLSIDSVPNEREPTLDSYLAFRSKAVVDADFEVVAPPATPCVSDSACRQFGESQLVGVLSHGDKPWGIYELWAWERIRRLANRVETYEDVHTVVAVPLFAPAPEAVACDPPSNDPIEGGGQGGSGGAGGSGGLGGSAGMAGSGGTGAISGMGGGGGLAGSGGSGGVVGTGGSSAGAGGVSGAGGAGGSAGTAGMATGGTGGSGAAEDSMISRLTPSQVNLGTNNSLVVDGEGFEADHSIYWGNTPLATTFVSDTRLTASLSTSNTNAAGFVEVRVEKPGAMDRSNIVYLPVIRGVQPEYVDYLKGWGSSGETVTILGRRFTDPTYVADGTNAVAVTLGAQMMWDGELLDTATFTLGDWNSGRFNVDGIIVTPFYGRDFRVEPNLVTGAGTSVSATTSSTGFEAALAVDGDLSTGWIAGAPCPGPCAGTGPTLRANLATPSSVRRIKIRGHRQVDGNDFLRTRVTLESFAGGVLWSREYAPPQRPQRDIDILLPTPIDSVFSVVVEGREDDFSAAGIAELEVYAN